MCFVCFLLWLILCCCCASLLVFAVFLGKTLGLPEGVRVRVMPFLSAHLSCCCLCSVLLCLSVVFLSGDATCFRFLSFACWRCFVVCFVIWWACVGGSRSFACCCLLTTCVLITEGPCCLMREQLHLPCCVLLFLSVVLFLVMCDSVHGARMVFLSARAYCDGNPPLLSFFRAAFLSDHDIG